jgi:hypothetical protein
MYFLRSTSDLVLAFGLRSLHVSLCSSAVTVVDRTLLQVDGVVTGQLIPSSYEGASQSRHDRDEENPFTHVGRGM